MTKHKRFFRIILAVIQAFIDLIIYRLSFLLVIAFRFSGKIPADFTFEVQTFFAGSMLLVFYFYSLYNFKSWTFWDEIKAILKSAILILLTIILFLYSQNFTLSRYIVIVGILFFVPLCIIIRYAFRRTLFALNILVTNVIILGAGKTGELYADKIISHPFTSCRVIGFLDDDEAKHGKLIAGFPVLGRLKDFKKIYASCPIDEAAVAISTASRSLLTHILDVVEFHVRQVHYIPDMYMLTTFSTAIKDVEGMPVISASQGLLNPLNRAVKTVIDYAGAFTALIILSPIMFWAACRTRRNHKGLIISAQKRTGWKTKRFTIYTFKTNTIIDNLPQLFNVLKREMSLVGPRALTRQEVKSVYGDYIARKIYAVKPGITGFWHISGTSEAEKDIMREMNLYYIRNWSLWLDAVILLRTIYAVFRKKSPPPSLLLLINPRHKKTPPDDREER